jgi:hypothetical protein
VSPVLRPRPVVGSRHLEEMLSPYADRRLSAATLLACDQHVSICPGCRGAADAERRLLSSLRTAATPGLSSRLEWALLDLAAHPAPPASASASASVPSPLAVMARSAPAMYRSPMRAAVLAGLVAGASAAAAWSLGVSGLGPSGGSLPVVRLPASAAASGSTIGYPSSSQAISFLSTGLLAPVEGPWPGVPNTSRRSAQLTHE